jgi:hypothetical protein
LNIIVEIRESDCRHWLLTLERDLHDAGYSVAFDLRPGGKALARSNRLALAIEAGLSGIHEHPWTALAPERLPRPPVAAGESRRLSLSGESADADLTLLLDGTPGIAALVDSLFSRRPPLVELRRRDGAIAASGVPAVEFQDVVVKGLEQVTRRLSTLVLMALDGRERPPPRTMAPRAGRFANALGFVANSLGTRLLRKIAPARFRADHWRVGIRAARPFSPEASQGIDGYHGLEDDGRRYYADPFLWTEDGRDYLFVEEYPLETRRGIIAYTELDAHGRPCFAPKPVIERATHLSYPFLFRHDGTLYMAPENATGGDLPLYRARRFPDLWEELPPLVPGQALHDATLFEHEGRWWILANHASHGRTNWDCLVIFHGASPLGPFEPHALNPVLVDARDTRSGGPVIPLDGKLYRPVQNCLEGYGKFIRFFEITALTPQTFEQRPAGEIAQSCHGAMSGVHTYGRSAKFEVIDALSPRGMVVNEEG